MFYALFINNETFSAYLEYCHQYGIISLPFGDVKRHYLVVDESHNPPRIHWMTPNHFHEKWIYVTSDQPHHFIQVKPL